jgi:hypothetical protein
MSKNGASLKIHYPSLIGACAKIELDGMDISYCLQGIELSMASDEVNRATIKILIEDLDVTVETLAMLQAHLKNKQQETA